MSLCLPRVLICVYMRCLPENVHHGSDGQHLNMSSSSSQAADELRFHADAAACDAVELCFGCGFQVSGFSWVIFRDEPTMDYHNHDLLVESCYGQLCGSPEPFVLRDCRVVWRCGGFQIQSGVAFVVRGFSCFLVSGVVVAFKR